MGSRGRPRVVFMVSVVDALVLGTVLIGVVAGMMRGFLSQATGLLGLFGGLWLAARFHGPVRRHTLDSWLATDHNGEIAFVGILVLTVVGFAVGGLLLRKVIAALSLDAYDRLMGAAFGLAKTGLLCGAILLGLVYIAPNESGIESAIGRSRVGPVLWKAMDRAASVLPGRVRRPARRFLEDHGLPRKTAEADPAGNGETSGVAVRAR